VSPYGPPRPQATTSYTCKVMEHLLIVLELILFACVSDARRLGVFVHGCNTFRSDEEWRHIVVGDPRTGRCGRIAAAIAAIDRLLDSSDDDLYVSWGSAIQSKEGFSLEGEYTLKLLTELESELRQQISAGTPFGACITKMKCLQRLTPERLQQLLSHIIASSSCQRTSTNTRSELREALEYFGNQQCEIVVLVSSSNHSPRCLRDASVEVDRLSAMSEAKGGGNSYRPPLILALSAETTYACAVAEDTLILEPPHILPVNATTVAFGTPHPFHAPRWAFHSSVRKLLQAPLDRAGHDEGVWRFIRALEDISSTFTF